MSKLPADVKFRIEVAARVLERAARKTSDPEFRRQLLEIAGNLRRAAGGDTAAIKEVEAMGARAKTIDELVKEIREWIWRGMSPRQYVPETQKPLEIDFTKRILKPLRNLEKLLEEIDRRLEEIL